MCEVSPANEEDGEGGWSVWDASIEDAPCLSRRHPAPLREGARRPKPPGSPKAPDASKKRERGTLGGRDAHHSSQTPARRRLGRMSAAVLRKRSRTLLRPAAAFLSVL
jgi:hypothetical protein